MNTLRLLRRFLPAAALAGAIPLGIAPAHAQATYLITLDTSSLNTAAYTGPFVLDFQFTDGDGIVTQVLDNNNTATISGFQGGTGFSTTTVSLGDGNPGGAPPTGDAQVGFTPGSTLSFVTTLTTFEDQMIPDEFSFAILNNGTAIPTQDAFGNAVQSFVTIDESSDSADPTALVVSTFDTSPAAFHPTVTPVAAPEPGGGVTLVVGLAAVTVAACAGRCRNRTVSAS